MADNPFDQFDAAPAANPFDQFDATSSSAPPKTAPSLNPLTWDWGVSPQDVSNTAHDLGRMAGLGVRGITQGVTAVPKLVEDAGIEIYNALTGSRHPTATQSLNQAFEQVPFMQAPQNAGERILEHAATDVAGASVPLPAPQSKVGEMLRMDKPPVAAQPTDAQLLADKGVTMTPGQIKGGSLGRVEEALQSVPVLGDFVRGARGEAVKQFSTSAIDDALSHIDQELPEGVAGHEAIAKADDLFDDAYSELLPKMKGNLYGGAPVATEGAVAEAGADQTPSLAAEINNLRTMAKNLPEQQRADFNRILDDEVIGKFTPQGMASGNTISDIRQTLSNEINDFKSGGPYERKLAGALLESKAAIDRMITRENPDFAEDLGDLNMGYAKFKIAQRAASAATKDGIFTPSQYLQAVKQNAAKISKDNARFASGQGLGQQLGSAGAEVLGSRLPDSGTAYRWWLERGLLGGAGGAAAVAGHPIAAAAGLTLPALYSQPVLKALQPLLLGHGPPLAPAVTAAIPTIASESQDEAPAAALKQQAAAHAEGGLVPDYQSELSLLRRYAQTLR